MGHNPLLVNPGQHMGLIICPCADKPLRRRRRRVPTRQPLKDTSPINLIVSRPKRRRKYTKKLIETEKHSFIM